MKQLAVVLFLTISLFSYEVKKVGDSIMKAELKNQYGEVRSISEDAELILYAPDKVSFDIAKDFLDGMNSGFLKSINALFIADLSNAPKFVRSLYIIPALKKHKYEILLIEDEFSPVIFESELKKVSVVFINKGKIVKIEKSDNLQKLFL